MRSATPSDACRECDGVSRREWIRGAVGGIAAGLAAPPLFAVARTFADKPTSETLATSLYKTLTDEQREVVCFPFNHELRSRVDNNWHIVPQRVGKFFTPDQQALIKDIFVGLHSPEYAAKVWEQVEHDNKAAGGFRDCSVALFGEPGTGQFEFVLTGRHVTRRCDGDSVEGAAFGGPIFYGHAFEAFNEKPNHAGNLYWYQALRANELFQALDSKQRRLALLGDSRGENGNSTVKVTGRKSDLPGIAATDLSADQKGLLRQVMADVLAPFRKPDVDEVLKLVDLNGGMDSLSIAYYKNEDIGNDSVWDVWQIEGPAMVWYFRGQPHVHTWVNVQARG